MKKLTRVATMVAFVILFAETSQADTVGITVKAGTLGLGADVTVPLVPSTLNLRAGYNWADLKLHVSLDQADSDGDFNWSTIPVLLDWHPSGGEFRLSGGIIINNNKVKLSSAPKEDFMLNNNAYAIESMDGSIKFDQVAWYLGIGSGNAVSDGHLHFSCDFGLMFQGKPKAEATATSAIPALQGALNSDLQVEVNKFQKDDLDSFIIYPVISVGMSLSF